MILYHLPSMTVSFSPEEIERFKNDPKFAREFRCVIEEEYLVCLHFLYFSQVHHSLIVNANRARIRTRFAARLCRSN